jgi:hypothetical protein
LFYAGYWRTENKEIKKKEFREFTDRNCGTSPEVL